MDTPRSPPTRLMVVPNKCVWPTRRPADLSVGSIDLIGSPYDLLKTFQKIPPDNLIYHDLKTWRTRQRPRWISPEADRWDMARCVT
jgi:hypothetical protein